MKRNDSVYRESGFSLLELLIVIIIIAIAASISLFYLGAYQKAYKPDEQSAVIGDLMQEARQRSLTQRETMRVEINADKRTVRLIDENGSLISDGNGDDEVIKEITLYPGADITFDRKPDNISVTPPEPIQVDPVVFYLSDYPGSVLDRVVTIRFKHNGTIADKNDVLYNGSLYVWSAKPGNANHSEISRSITFLGGSGFIRFWEWNTSITAGNKWQNSRR